MKSMSAGSSVVVVAAMLAINATQACGGQYEAPSPAHTKSVALAPIEPVTAPANAPVASTVPQVTKTPIVEAKDQKANAPAPTAMHLTVKRLVVAHGVKEHEPIDPATSFKLADAGRIYAFVEVANAEKEPGEIFVSFEQRGTATASPARLTYGDVMLSVGASPRWRTWAFTRTAREAGEWVAVVRNAKGEVLARAPFEVTL